MNTAVGYTWTFFVALRHPKGIEVMQSIRDRSDVSIKKKKKESTSSETFPFDLCK